jgi:hypothetical protein
VEQTGGKNDSHILRLDTAESVGKPAGTQLLGFLVYGSDHSDRRGTKSTPLPFSGGRNVMSAGSLDLWIDLMPESPFGDMLTVRSFLVQPVKPPNAYRVGPLKTVSGTDRKSKTIIGAAR